MNPESALPPVDAAGTSHSITLQNPPPPSTLRKVLIGTQGLRAGWSVLIFILILGAFLGAEVLLMLKLFPEARNPKNIQNISLKFGYFQEGLTSLSILAATWIMAKIERCGRSYGYGGANKLKLFLAGMVSGLILISLLVFVLWKGGWLVIENQMILGGDVVRYGTLWLFAFILVGVFEESLTRGFLLYTLTRGFSSLYRWAFKTPQSEPLGFWTAATILSVVFFLGHTGNPGESPFGLLAVFIGGLFFSLSVWRTGSMWWGIGMHAAWDWGQSFLFGVADSGIIVQHHLLATHPEGKLVLSGGTTGPEGSILVMAVLALGALIIIFTLPKGRYLDEPFADQSAHAESPVAATLPTAAS